MLVQTRVQCSGVLRTWSLLLSTLGVCSALMAQTLTWLGTLPGGNYSRAYGVSADGSVVVGEAANLNSQPSAFRWTRNTNAMHISERLEEVKASLMGSQRMETWLSASPTTPEVSHVLFGGIL